MTEAGNGRRTTVLIADDHPVMRHGLRLALEEDPALSVEGEAGDGEAALQGIQQMQPDVAVLDLDMPRLNGLAVSRAVQKQGLTTAVVILTLHTGSDLLFEALAAGVKGYVLKSYAVGDVVAAVQRAASGESFLSGQLLTLLSQRHAEGAVTPAAMATLSPTERSIIQAVSHGKTSREIASAMDLSVRTIENYRTHICSKLDLTGANALLRFALSLRQNTKSWADLSE